MRQNAERREGVYLHALEAGSTIDIETRSRRYQIEYLEGTEYVFPATRGAQRPPWLVSADLQGRLGWVRRRLHWMPDATGVRTIG